MGIKIPLLGMGSEVLVRLYLARVWSTRAGIEDPDQGGTDGEEDHAAPVEGLDWNEREQDTDDEGAECGDGRSPTDDTASLGFGQNHGHLLECSGIAQSGEEEHREHGAEEPPELIWIGGVQKECGHGSKHGHADTANESLDCSAVLIAQWTPSCTYGCADEWSQEGIGGTLRQIIYSNGVNEGRAGTVDLVNNQRELRGETSESEVSQVLFRLSRWEDLEHAKEI